MQSSDWPDLPFVEAKAYGRGRDGQIAMYSVIHYTAGSERSTSAEDGAAYDQRRTDGTSTTYFHDSDSTVQTVLLANRANSAFYHGNRQGIHHELCGSQQTREQWLDPASRATIRRAAFQIVRDHERLGIPYRRLSPAQVRACWNAKDRSIGGICGHVDITRAWPEDNGTHEDPGTSFPWDVLFSDIEEFRSGGNMAAFDLTVSSGDGAILEGVSNARVLRSMLGLLISATTGERRNDLIAWNNTDVPSDNLWAILRAIDGRMQLPGTSTPELPAEVTLSAEQLDDLAGRVVARLGALQYVPQAPAA